MGFGAFIMKGVGNGTFQTGLTYTVPTLLRADSELGINSKKDLKASGSGYFSIPVIVSYAFF
jgi:hypothetical protein